MEKIQTNEKASVIELLKELILPIREHFQDLQLSTKQRISVAATLLSMAGAIVSSTPEQSSGSYAGIQSLDLGSKNAIVIDEYNITRYENPYEGKNVIVLRPGSNGVNVRSQPNTSGNILTVMSSNDMFISTGEVSEGGWYQIELTDGSLGWITGEYSQELPYEEAIANKLENNPNLVQMSRVDIDGLAIFNIEQSILTAEMVYRISEVVRSRTYLYPGAQASAYPIAVVFGDTEQMLKLAPSKRNSLVVNGKAIGGFAKEKIITTSDGLFLAPYGYGIGGDVLEMAFVLSPHNTLPLFEVTNMTAHELSHEWYGQVSGHVLLPNGLFDYTMGNPAVFEGKMAEIAADGVEVCEYYQEAWIEACKAYAEAIFGPLEEGLEPEIVTYAEGTIEVQNIP